MNHSSVVKNQYTPVCSVCEKPIPICEEPSPFCCSPSCSGKLAQSTRYVNEAKKQYKTKEKAAIREFLYKRYVKPKAICEEPRVLCFNILDFWGGGGFSDHIIDHSGGVKNHEPRVNLYEIEQDKKMWPALRKYAREKNHGPVVKNHSGHVIPFCGSLAEFVRLSNVKNQGALDFIWLDYCGNIKQAHDDLPLLHKVADERTTIAITAFCSRDGMISKKGRNLVLDGWVRESFPLHRKQKIFEYNGMGVFIYKVPSGVFRKLSYLFK